MTYTEMIIADTKCAPDEAKEIESIMRDDIFHSTLDWQTRAQFRRGAKQAYEVFIEVRKLEAAGYRNLNKNELGSGR